MDPQTSHSSEQPIPHKVRLENDPVIMTPEQPEPSELGKKLTEQMTTEVEEAIGDVARRKEYREALARSGITMDWMVENLKNIAIQGEKDSDKIKALQVLLKSVGVDKATGKEEEATNSWEEALIKESEKTEVPKDPTADYEVNEPEIPKKAADKRKADNDVTGSIYD